ncbi:hypothetical protein PR048_025152 [Dryococelus australis]|uniref:Uncharacterized protein n=1 Tax=Dryococelus australis TaxID=614101 RepID=A0ABQ9GQI4_9NEOP|nr:hypothetical protein PR048_025152 [Dryococelus australis]
MKTGEETGMPRARGTPYENHCPINPASFLFRGIRSSRKPQSDKPEISLAGPSPGSALMHLYPLPQRDVFYSLRVLGACSRITDIQYRNFSQLWQVSSSHQFCFLPSLHSGATVITSLHPHRLLKASMLRAAQISSLILCPYVGFKTCWEARSLTPTPPWRPISSHSCRNVATAVTEAADPLMAESTNPAGSMHVLNATSLETRALFLKATTVSLFASHQGDPGSISGRVTSDFRKWESCCMMPLVGRFSRRSPVSPTPSFRCCPATTSITLIGSEDHDVKSRPNISTLHSTNDSLACRPRPIPLPGLTQIHPEPATPRVNTVRSQQSRQTAVSNDPLENSGHGNENWDVWSPYATLKALLLVALLADHGVHADLLVVLLEGGQVLPGLGELALLHALADVPVHEGALRVHQVELVVETGPRLGDRRRVGQHADGTVHLRASNITLQVTHSSPQLNTAEQNILKCSQHPAKGHNWSQGFRVSWSCASKVKTRGSNTDDTNTDA